MQMGSLKFCRSTKFCTKLFFEIQSGEKNRSAASTVYRMLRVCNFWQFILDFEVLISLKKILRVPIK